MWVTARYAHPAWRTPLRFVFIFPGRAWYVFSFFRRQNKLRFSVITWISFPTGHAVSKENARSEETQYCHWLYNGFIDAWDRPVFTH